MKTTLLLFTLALVAHVTAAPALANRGVGIGEQAPAFTLTDAHGQTHSLSDYSGQYVVLEWLNHDCPFVVKHYNSGNMQQLQQSYTEKGVVWFSVISSAPGEQGYLEPDEAVAITAEKGAHPTAVLLDPEGTVGRAFDARVTPHMYIIDPEGNLAYMGAIDDIRSTNVDDVPRARNFVSEALDLLMAGNAVETTVTQPYGCTVKY